MTINVVVVLFFQKPIGLDLILFILALAYGLCPSLYGFLLLAKELK